MTEHVRKLILILGDQLTPALLSLAVGNAQHDTVLMAEVEMEATYVRHHKKKIAFIFSAMRHFANELRALGWTVIYRTIDETGSNGSLTGEVARALKTVTPDRIVVTEPGEWRLRAAMADWPGLLGVPVDVIEDRRFICSHAEFRRWAHGRKQLRMEYFYREMRRKTGLLMRGDAPEGGQWNFDHDNRKPATADLLMPQPRCVAPDRITTAVLKIVGKRYAGHFGDLKPFWFAVTRTEAEAALDHFVENALPRFGDFQDAMLEGERFLYHSVLSPYVKCGLLDPLNVCRRIETAYRAGAVPLNAAEGFIRQIIGVSLRLR